MVRSTRFLENATIVGVDNIDETQVAKGTIKKILENVNIANDGHLYTTDSSVTLSGGGGSGATALIEEVGLGGLDEIIVSTEDQDIADIAKNLEQLRHLLDLLN